jgi:hypothetical protein
MGNIYLYLYCFIFDSKFDLITFDCLVCSGKYFLNLIHFDLPNDIYVHILGSYLIGSLGFGIYFIISQVRQRFFFESLTILFKWTLWVFVSLFKVQDFKILVCCFNILWSVANFDGTRI